MRNHLLPFLSHVLLILIITILLPSPQLVHALTFQKRTRTGKVPSWSDLETKFLSPLDDESSSSSLSSSSSSTTTTSTSKSTSKVVTLYRERNGWCVYSARLWFALELKNIQYDTVLLDSKYDTYDGSESSSDDCIMQEDWPSDIDDDSLPQLRITYKSKSSSSNDDEEQQQQQLYNGSTESSSLKLLEFLDEAFPDSIPLWPPVIVDDSNGAAKEQVCITANDVTFMANEFGSAVSKLQARESPRAFGLFSKEEGYRLDPCSRSSFEIFLDKAEHLLNRYPSGPFFCGSTLSAADVVWAPLLERYAVQLPCLHKDLQPRGNLDHRWPSLDKFYKAMDQVPVYACRIKGDAQSWRKVLFVDPWWPSADLWHPRDTVGPKGELLLSEEECYQVFGGDSSVLASHNVWTEYYASSLRPGVVADTGPESEACAVLIRNHPAIVKDAEKRMEENGISVTVDDLDVALRIVVVLLMMDNHKNNKVDEHINNKDEFLEQKIGVVVRDVLAYLDNRICVPRDMGAPPAATIRALYQKSLNGGSFE